MACKRRTNGGTQWNTCRRTTLGPKLVGKMHPMVSKQFQNGSFWAKMPGAHKSDKGWYSMEYMQEDINKNQQLETVGESSVSTHYAYFSLFDYFSF